MQQKIYGFLDNLIITKTQQVQTKGGGRNLVNWG